MEKQHFSIMVIISLMILVTSYAQIVNNAFGQVVTTEPVFVNIDVSGRPTAGLDYPFGITCNDPTYRFVTLFGSGAIVRIAKSDGTYTIYDNNAVAAGEDWYSLVSDPSSGKIYANYKDMGKTAVFNPSSGTYGTTIPVINVSELTGLGVTYTESTNTLTYSSSSANLGFSSFGELKATNGFIWQVLDYNYDLNVLFSGSGLPVFQFHGIVKIDPTTDTVVARHSISGASALRGISIDVTDSTILWITDINADKLFKFDTDTGLVTDTVTFTVGTKPRGIANDVTNIYIAMNQAGGSGNSKILQVAKSDYTKVELDTVAINSGGGAFSAYVVDGTLFWTDESSHIGTIQISNPAITTVTNTSTQTNTNHFACIEGNTITFTGHGSAKVGTFSISNSESNTGDSNMHKSRSTFGKDHQTFNQIVENGFTFDGIPIKITDNFHTEYPLINITTGTIHSIIIKSYNPHGLFEHGIGFGCKEKGDTNCEVWIEAWYNHDKKLKEPIVIRQNDKIIDDNAVVVIGLTETKCQDIDKNENCDQTTFILKFNEPLINKPVLLQAIDFDRRVQNTWLNEGISVDGKSLNEPKTIQIGGNHGLIKLTQIDRQNNIWLDDSNIEYNVNDFGTFIRITPIEISHRTDQPMNVMTRLHSEFGKLIEYEQQRATLKFDSDKFQKEEPTYYTYEVNANCDRPCDSVPMMMQAQANLAMKKVGKS